MKIRMNAAVALILGHLIAPAAIAVELPGPLVSPLWLTQHRTEVNIVDVRADPASFTGDPEFSTDKGSKSLSVLGGHIPGALLLDFEKVRTTQMIDGRQIKWMLPSGQDFQALMRSIGVKADRPTVIVPEGLSGEDLDMAARTFWSMKVYGDDHLAILSGGTAAWLQQGLAFSTAAAAPAAGSWSATAPRLQYLATSNDVSKAMGSAQLVDARSMPFYLGLQKKPMVESAGHLQGAVDLPSDVRTTTTDGITHFLTPGQYTTIFRHLGITADKPTITYCNTGHLAAGAWFVLSEIMKNPDTRLYDGSMYEWTVEKRPVVGLP